MICGLGYSLYMSLYISEYKEHSKQDQGAQAPHPERYLWLSISITYLAIVRQAYPTFIKNIWYMFAIAVLIRCLLYYTIKNLRC